MERMLIRGNNILFGTPGKCNFSSGHLLIEDGIIIDFSKHCPDVESENTLNTGSMYVLPGFIDVHTHAAVGIDSTGCTGIGLQTLANFFASKGVTGFLPTLTTNSKEILLQSIGVVAQYMLKYNDGAQVLGLHMEGPCLNAKYKGAQNEDYLTAPRVEDFADYLFTSGNTLRLVTIAPELTGAMDVIDYLRNNKVAINIGHSDADFDTCICAIEHGVGCVSHFLNGMKLFHQHDPSIMGAVFVNEKTYAEIICDGFHLVRSTVYILTKIIGPNRLILVTDSIIATGWSDGLYHPPSFKEPLVVENGDTHLEISKSRAGSTITMDRAFKNYMSFSGLSIKKAIQCVSINPAKHIGMDDKYGSIETGKHASLTILDSNLNVVYTIVNGKIAYKL